jgi:predicted transcriptional regulator
LSKPHHLTELQLAILEILWELGEATSQEVREALAPERVLALTTVSTLLSRLTRKGAVTYHKEGRQFVYRPVVTRRAVRRSMVDRLTRGLFGGDPAALVSHLVARGDMKPGDLSRIRLLIEEAEAETE